MSLKKRAAAAATAAAAGRLRAFRGDYGVVWTSVSLREAWQNGMATDCFIEKRIESSTEVWRVELRERRHADDLGEVFDEDGRRQGRLVRAERNFFTVEAV